MSSSPSAVSIDREPSGARVLQGSADVALAALLDAQVDVARTEASKQAVAETREQLAAPLVDCARALEHDALEQREHLIQSAIGLGALIASELLGRSVETGDYDIEAIVRRCLAETGAERSGSTVHLNPDDMARLDGVGFSGDVTLQADTNVRRGDVQVESPHGLLVRSLSDSMQAIESALRAELRPGDSNGMPASEPEPES